MLVIGFIANLLVRPVAARWHMSEQELAEERRIAHEKAAAAAVGRSGGAGSAQGGQVVAIGFWLLVGIPLAWGIWVTVTKALKLFH
jgi:hypothetical protein